jgi:acyl-CoA thioester hydrolase
MGRISDGIGTLMKGFRKELAAVQASSDMQIGGAALEYRLIYHRRPIAGDLVAVYAGLSKVTDKIFVLNHWTVDLVSGEPLCSSEDVAVSLDLVARKAVSIPAEFKAVYQSHVIANLDQEVAPV